MKNDCLSCGHSFSTDENRLVCTLKNETVKDDDHCEDHN